MPVTIPIVLTVATPVALLLHAPPPMLLVRGIEDPTQTFDHPDIVPVSGAGATVMVLLAIAVPQPLVTA